MPNKTDMEKTKQPQTYSWLTMIISTNADNTNDNDDNRIHIATYNYSNNANNYSYNSSSIYDDSYINEIVLYNINNNDDDYSYKTSKAHVHAPTILDQAKKNLLPLYNIITPNTRNTLTDKRRQHKTNHADTLKRKITFAAHTNTAMLC